jgi:DNA phosphorothioation-dependent restriction protein DptG
MHHTAPFLILQHLSCLSTILSAMRSSRMAMTLQRWVTALWTANGTPVLLVRFSVEASSRQTPQCQGPAPSVSTATAGMEA